MKEIIDRLQENRQIELAKDILESHGYKVEKVKRLKEGAMGRYSTKKHIQDIKHFLTLVPDNSSSWKEMKANPMDYDMTSSYLEEIERVLGGSDIVIYSNEESDYGDEFSPAFFEPLQHAGLYRGTEKKVELPDDNSGFVNTLIKSPLGNILQTGGWGLSYVYMTTDTRDKLMRYLDKSERSLANYLSKWSDYYTDKE